MVDDRLDGKRYGKGLFKKEGKEWCYERDKGKMKGMKSKDTK
jgi:hypothetical protein